MINYKKLVDKILEADDYVSVIKEVKLYYVQKFKDFEKLMQDFDKRVKAKGINTDLIFAEKPDGDGTLQWRVDQGYMDDPERYLSVKSFKNGKVECDKTKRFRVPGSTNLNELVDVNQILQLIDGYVYSLERNDDPDNPKPEKTEDELDDAFELDPSVVKALEVLKVKGNNLIDRFKAVPAMEFNGKKYKLDKGTLMASTEKELILNLLFPRDQEIDIYAKDKKAQDLRRALVNHFQKNGFKGKETPQFRYDMYRTPYFYVPVGDLPVKQTKGPEARAILNYYDGNKVKFQPKESK